WTRPRVPAVTGLTRVRRLVRYPAVGGRAHAKGLIFCREISPLALLQSDPQHTDLRMERKLIRP
ncbi:MAG: hypothetical protein KDB01_21965, partial [Planctomycetaceae bacterium]|nr:hypothetical protein [Planctomycetaceae bacterium]